MNFRERHPELETQSHLNNLHSHVSQFHRADIVKDPLYVIAPIFNPQRYRIRWKHYLNFEKHILDSGAHLVLIEASFGNRSEVFTEKIHERLTIINVRTNQEIWLKENMINLAIQQLPADWKYVAWIDADIQFVRPDWVGETIHQLQHYDIVQMFSVAFDLDPNFMPYGINYSFMHDYVNGVPNKDMNIEGSSYGKSVMSKKTPGLKVNRWHPGFAWAARRDRKSVV